MKTRVIANSHGIEDKVAENNRSLPPDPLESALENSVRELILLAKYYQKHGYLMQAQEIYYYILTIQERREKRKDQEREPSQASEDFLALENQKSKIANRRANDPQLKQIGTTSAYGMCALRKT
jgi:hypothetical protein